MTPRLSDVDEPACTPLDDWAFFPGKGDTRYQLVAARSICERCPVIQPCLAYALAHEVVGVWAGTTEPQRAAMRRAAGIRAQPLTTDTLGLTDPSPRNLARRAARAAARDQDTP